MLQTFTTHSDLWLVSALLLAAIFMFVRNKPQMDVVGLLMIAALPFTGTITIQETLMGFSDPNIILIALLFVLGEGLVRTGVARDLGDWIHQKAGRNETKLIALLMVAVAGLGSVMSSTAVVAIFIPVVFRICRNTGVSPSLLMMPMSFAALISGMLSLVATAPNLVVNAELMRQTGKSFHFFSVTPFGLIILFTGVLYMLFARRWLPRQSGSAGDNARPSFNDWIESYQLHKREFRARVLSTSPLVGNKIADLKLRKDGINLLAIERASRRSIDLIRPSASTQLDAGDILLFDVRTDTKKVETLMETYHLSLLALLSNHTYLTDHAQELGMSEALIPAESSLVGKTVREARIKAESGLTVIGLRRGQRVIHDAFLDQNLNVGDTLLLTGFWQDLKRAREDKHELVILHLPREIEEVLPAARKGRQALFTMALVVALMVSGVLPNVHAVLLGCLLMGIFGCINTTSAYDAINWKSLVLIVGMIPFSLALQRTGGVDLFASALLNGLGEASPRLSLAAIFLITAVLGMFISNTATAVLMAPVALAIAQELGVSPYPFAIIVALAASTAFMTPVSSPVNTLVVIPGNYSFADFIKIGVPFSIVAMILSVVFVPWFLPFY